MNRKVVTHAYSDVLRGSRHPSWRCHRWSTWPLTFSHASEVIKRDDRRAAPRHMQVRRLFQDSVGPSPSRHSCSSPSYSLSCSFCWLRRRSFGISSMFFYQADLTEMLQNHMILCDSSAWRALPPSCRHSQAPCKTSGEYWTECDSC